MIQCVALNRVACCKVHPPVARCEMQQWNKEATIGRCHRYISDSNWLNTILISNLFDQQDLLDLRSCVCIMYIAHNGIQRVCEREGEVHGVKCAKAIVCAISCQDSCCKIVQGSHCEFSDSFLFLLNSCIVYKLCLMAKWRSWSSYECSELCHLELKCTDISEWKWIYLFIYFHTSLLGLFSLRWYT